MTCGQLFPRVNEQAHGAARYCCARCKQPLAAHVSQAPSEDYYKPEIGERLNALAERGHDE